MSRRCAPLPNDATVLGEGISQLDGTSDMIPGLRTSPSVAGPGNC